MRRTALATLLYLTTAACSSFATSPDMPAEAGGIRLEGSISSQTVRIGEEETLTFRLRNITRESIKLDFSSGCQITHFIETATGADVYPGGGYGCTQAATTITIPPGGEELRSLRVYGGERQQAIYTGHPLPRGSYRAYAILEPNTRGIQLRSEFVYFEVR